MAANYPYLIFLLAILFLLFSKRVMSNTLWRATMTPLASIIGSGFLVAAPLLNHISGSKAPFVMLGLCIASFSIGEVIRWNILNLEPLLENKAAARSILLIEKLGNWALAFAYILSITYYLYLFSSFLLKAIGLHNLILEKSITTIVLWPIAYFGHQNGLSSLEKIEAISVNLKLSFILTFILGLIAFNYNNQIITAQETESLLRKDSIGVILGLLIMVQGFETSRYLGEKYSPSIRIKSMRYSQVLSTAIYLIFIILFVPIFKIYPMPSQISETSVIDIGKYVFSFGPILLFLAAISSQLSAAVADLGGSGGLFSELTEKKITSKNAYLVIAIISTILIWSFNIFSIISFASKAFALYYFFQSLSSFIFFKNKNIEKTVFSMFCLIICLSVLIFGKSFE